EVAGEDRREAHPLQQRLLRVGRQREHPLAVVDPARLTVEEAVVRQLGGAHGNGLELLELLRELVGVTGYVGRTCRLRRAAHNGSLPPIPWVLSQPNEQKVNGG